MFSSTTSTREKGAEIIGILKEEKSDGVFKGIFIIKLETIKLCHVIF